MSDMSTRILLKIIFTGTAGLIIFMSVAGATVPLPTKAWNVPYVDNPDPTLRDEPFLAWHEDLRSSGYVEKEIFFSGIANEYEYIDEAAQSPLAQPIPDMHGAYTTRMIIRRPFRPAKFNGVVYLEILNATAGYDGSPHWNLTHESIIADGAAYVGITYSDLTAEFLTDEENGWAVAHTDYAGCPTRTDTHPAPCGSQSRNNSRYLSGATPILNIPTRAYTWDILNQAAALLKTEGLKKNPFFNFPVDTIIAVGYSQSARYVTTYGNSFYPSYSELDCSLTQEALAQCTDPVVDGFIVAAGGGAGSKLNGQNSHTPGDRRNCENALNREAPCIEGAVEPIAADPLAHKLPKVMRFMTESDIKAVRARQDEGVLEVAKYDQPNLRNYEVAGASHVDFWGAVVGSQVGEYQFGIPANPAPAGFCDLPMNPLRTGIPLSAVQHRMARWIKYDELPPPNHFMEWEGDFTQFDEIYNPLVNWVRDDDNNTIGGVRPPRINVPLGTYYGSNFFSGPSLLAKIYCTGIYGGFDAFSAQELQNRYTNHSNYVFLTWWNMYLSYSEGFLLPVDAKTIMDEAKAYEGLP
jgi:hypothetical protein